MLYCLLHAQSIHCLNIYLHHVAHSQFTYTIYTFVFKINTHELFI